MRQKEGKGGKRGVRWWDNDTTCGQNGICKLGRAASKRTLAKAAAHHSKWVAVIQI